MIVQLEQVERVKIKGKKKSRAPPFHFFNFFLFGKNKKKVIFSSHSKHLFFPPFSFVFKKKKVSRKSFLFRHRHLLVAQVSLIFVLYFSQPANKNHFSQFFCSPHGIKSNFIHFPAHIFFFSFFFFLFSFPLHVLLSMQQ